MWFIGNEVEQETSAPSPKRKIQYPPLGLAILVSALGLKIFHKISPRTDHNYL